MTTKSRLDLALEQRVLKGLKALPGRPHKLLLAISGGVDSLVMGEILWRWRQGLHLTLAVAHIHHGPADKKRQSLYRRKAQRFVAQWAQQKGLPYLTNVSGKVVLRGEQELREYRRACLDQWQEEGGFDAIAFAHHQDDLLETRLIRLIRGSGGQGLRAMSLYHQNQLRPLLVLSRAEVRDYARIRALPWLEDPSNQETHALRNWLRQAWLPALERQRPGASRALARSLESLSPVTRDFDFALYVGLRRDLFRKVESGDQRVLLANYLRALGVRGYGGTHIEEILKRLDTRRKNFTFKMLGLSFEISPEYLRASRV